MTDVREEFDSRLHAGFDDAEVARVRIKRVKGLARQRPEELAVRIIAAIPRKMEELGGGGSGRWVGRGHR